MLLVGSFIFGFILFFFIIHWTVSKVGFGLINRTGADQSPVSPFNSTENKNGQKLGSRFSVPKGKSSHYIMLMRTKAIIVCSFKTGQTGRQQLPRIHLVNCFHYCCCCFLS